MSPGQRDDVCARDRSRTFAGQPGRANAAMLVRQVPGQSLKQESSLVVRSQAAGTDDQRRMADGRISGRSPDARDTGPCRVFLDQQGPVVVRYILGPRLGPRPGPPRPPPGPRPGPPRPPGRPPGLPPPRCGPPGPRGLPPPDGAVRARPTSTVSGLPLSSLPFIASMAALPSVSPGISTKPNPLDSPVAPSLTILTVETSPKAANA